LIFNRICFGSLKVVALHDKINWNLHSIEFFIFTILYLINLLFGIFPNCILDLSSIFSSYLHNIYISL
jgi:NADH:ubiquinone oxidoreductase subunit 4 (subunit M)